MWPDSLGLDVSRESLEKLEVYHALLLKWQKAINLVSKNTVADAAVRHFADSVQLSRFIPAGTQIVMDWGSGAGFPGLVLAILRPEIAFHMVESDERKCQFMRTVSRETSAPIRIHTQRIEDLELAFQPDVITARALASVDKLLGYAEPWVAANPDLRLLFLKGEQAVQEVAQARELYGFDVASSASVTNPGASILEISNVHKLG